MAGEICMCADAKHAGNRDGVHGKVHGTLSSFVNMWHECTDCGKTFCDECGRSCLAGKNEDTDHTRVCPECGSATKLF